MSDEESNWQRYQAECFEAADKAEKRSANLSVFGVLAIAGAIVAAALYVVAILVAESDDAKDDVAILAPAAVGVMLSFVFTSVVLFAAASLVEIAAKQLRLRLMLDADDPDADD